ncbi:MAG: NUDIX domain-containing protein [Firmicutes bacterium]|nr:NUDIX domain-containing protein [Bacillota bacterium]
MLKEVSSGAIAYFMDNWPVDVGPVTSQSAGEAGREPRILMIHDAFGQWTFPKGLVEDGESVEETALRELREETGIEGTIEHSLGRAHYFYHTSGRDLVSKTVHYFLVRSEPREPVPLLAEIRDAKWVDLVETRRLNGYRNNLDVLDKAIELIERHSRK